MARHVTIHISDVLFFQNLILFSDIILILNVKFGLNTETDGNETVGIVEHDGKELMKCKNSSMRFFFTVIIYTLTIAHNVAFYPIVSPNL